MDKSPLLDKEDGPRGVFCGRAGGSGGGYVPPTVTRTSGGDEGGQEAAGKNRGVVFVGQTFSERQNRTVLRLLWLSAWMGIASLVVLIALLAAGKLDATENWRVLVVTNVAAASLGAIIMISCTIWYVLCLVHVTKKGQVFKRREIREAYMHIGVFLSQCVNCVAYLVPNAMVLIAGDGKVKAAHIVWSLFIRFTMWNNIYLVFTLRSRFLNPWINLEGKPVGEKKDSLLIDAPFWKHWYLPVPWLAYQALLVVTLIFRLKEVKESGEYTYFGKGSNVFCEGKSVEKFAFNAIDSGLLIYQLIGIIFCYRGCLKLKKVSYILYRWTNIIIRYHFKHFIIINLFIAISFIFVDWVPGSECAKRILIGFGLLPAQIVMTMQSAINCIVAAPVVLEDYSEDDVDPNRLIWMESPVARQNETVDKIDHAPRFCFETALKAKFWSWAAYNYDRERKKIRDPEGGPPQAMDLAMQMYDLTDHDYLVEEERDTHVLIAWSNQTVVVSFRGTASRTNAVTDIKAWRISYPIKQSVCLPGIRSAVHAGFADSWRSEGLNTRVVDKVREILCGKDFDKPNSKIIITGHSLGGAMAILAAYDIAAELEEGGVLPKEQILCYTFGAPRVGNTTFASKYDSQVPNTWQVVNDRDVIPALPKFGVLYRHVGRKVFLNTYGDLIVNPTIVEFSQRMRFTFILNLTSMVSDHYLDDYKDSLGSILRCKGKGLEGGDEAVPEVLFKNDGVLSKIYGVGSDELMSC